MKFPACCDSDAMCASVLRSPAFLGGSEVASDRLDATTETAIEAPREEDRGA